MIFGRSFCVELSTTGVGRRIVGSLCLEVKGLGTIGTPGEAFSRSRTPLTLMRKHLPAYGATLVFLSVMVALQHHLQHHQGLNRSMVDAAMRHDVAAVKRLLAIGADVDARNHN